MSENEQKKKSNRELELEQLLAAAEKKYIELETKLASEKLQVKEKKIPKPIMLSVNKVEYTQSQLLKLQEESKNNTKKYIKKKKIDSIKNKNCIKKDCLNIVWR